MIIRPLDEPDARAWWNLRLEGLIAEPFAFSKDVAEHESTSIETTASRVRQTAANFTLGAFDDGVLIGVATFRRESGRKERHKGHVLGVYVTEAHRGRGVGGSLIADLIARTLEDATVEQLMVAVAARSEAAVRLYRRRGFITFGIEPRALKIGAEYTDVHHMMLDLGQVRSARLPGG